MVRITIVYDNTVYERHKGLKADWGFACLVEGEKIPTILFDTGTSGDILLSNMEKLSINIDKIKMVFISHSHLDHTGGLLSFIRKVHKLTIYVPPSFANYLAGEGVDLRVVATPMVISREVFSTGELKGIEQSMVVGTEKGMILVVGCSHPGMQRILHTASRFGVPYAVVGGLHDFKEYELFKGLGLVCPSHCTMHETEIKRLYPEKYIEGGVGRVIEI